MGRFDPRVVALIDLQRMTVMQRLGDREGAARVFDAIDPERLPRGEIAKLARTRMAENDWDGAAALLACAIAQEERRAPVSGNLALLRSLLAEAQELAGRHAEAQAAMTAAIATYEQLSAHAMVVAPLLLKLARIEKASGNSGAAVAACRRVLSMPARVRAVAPYRESGPQDPLVAAHEEAQQVLASITPP